MKKSKNCMTVIVLTMLLSGCASQKIVTTEKVVIPRLDFPEFPLADSMTRNSDGTVSVPEEWIVRLEEYHIKIYETEEVYDGLRKLYGIEEEVR